MPGKPVLLRAALALTRRFRLTLRFWLLLCLALLLSLALLLAYCAARLTGSPRLAPSLFLVVLGLLSGRERVRSLVVICVPP